MSNNKSYDSTKSQGNPTDNTCSNCTKDCIKNTAEKCARNTGYTIISIDNLGNDYEYYLKRNNYESLNNWDTSKLSIKELNLKVERLLENFNTKLYRNLSSLGEC